MRSQQHATAHALIVEATCHCARAHCRSNTPPRTRSLSKRVEPGGALLRAPFCETTKGGSLDNCRRPMFWNTASKSRGPSSPQAEPLLGDESLPHFHLASSEPIHARDPEGQDHAYGQHLADGLAWLLTPTTMTITAMLPFACTIAFVVNSALHHPLHLPLKISLSIGLPMYFIWLGGWRALYLQNDRASSSFASPIWRTKRLPPGRLFDLVSIVGTALASFASPSFQEGVEWLKTSDSPETVGVFWWNVGHGMPSFFRGLLFQFSKESFRYTCSMWIVILLLGAVYLQQPSLNEVTRYTVVQLLSDTLSGPILTTLFKATSCTYTADGAYLDAAPTIICWTAVHLWYFVPCMIVLIPYYFFSILSRMNIQTSQTVILVDPWFFAFKSQLKVLAALLTANFGHSRPLVLLPPLLVVNVALMIGAFCRDPYNVALLTLVERVGMMIATWSVMVALLPYVGVDMSSVIRLGMLMVGYLLSCFYGRQVILNDRKAPPHASGSTSIAHAEESEILIDDPHYHQVVEECGRIPTGIAAFATVKLQDRLNLPFESITIQHIHSKQFRSLEVHIRNVRTVSGLAEGLPRSLYGKEPPVPWYLTWQVVLAKVVSCFESLFAKSLPTYFTSQEQHGSWDKYELKITSHLREAQNSQVLVDWLVNASLLKNLVSLDLSGNEIGSEGAKALAVALTPTAQGGQRVSRSAYQRVSLYGNSIGLEGAKALADALTPTSQGMFSGSLNTLEEGVFNASLNTLDVRRNRITGDAAQQLAEAVLKHPSMKVFNKIMILDIKDDKLRELNLKDMGIGVPGALVLSKLLAFNGSLNTLNLSVNQLCGLDKFGDGTYDASGIKALADALTFSKSLDTLDLSDNLLCGVAHGRGTYVASGIKALADALTFNKSLKTLKLRFNDIDTLHRRCSFCGCNKSGLRYYYCLECTDFDSCEECFRKHDHEHQMHPWVRGSEALAKALAFNTSLNTLDVRMNNITGDAAQQLAEAVLKHPCIKEFNKIRMQDIRDDKIAELDLRGKGIGLPGALVLSKLLVFNGSLNTLNLHGNKIGDEGAKALPAALTPNEEGVFNGSLNALHLGDNDIGPEGAKALAGALTPNAEGGFNTLLNTLNLRSNGIRDEGAKALTAALTPNEKGVFNTSLNKLDLTYNEIGPAGAKALAVALTPNEQGVFNTSLSTLDLGGNTIGPKGATALAVALTPNVKGVFNTSLNTLDLSNNKIGPDGAKALAVALSPNEEGVVNTSLNTLNLSGNRLCGVVYGGGTYDASGIKALADALAFNTSLDTLKLDGNEIGPIRAKALAVALTPNAEGVFNKSLNRITIAKGAELPIGALMRNEITELDLSGKGLWPEDAIILGAVLMFNGSLNTLSLRRNKIGPEVAKALAAALTPNEKGMFNGSLKTLNLSENKLCGVDQYGQGTYDASGIKALADALTFSKSLDTLDLSGNLLCGMAFYGGGTYDASGIKALADALAFNKSLKTLRLGCNQLCGVEHGDGTYDASGIKALANALVFNKSLNTLVLEKNNIGDEGAEALAISVAPNKEGVFNTSLNTLSLYDNDIGDEGTKALAVALTPNEEGVFNTSLNTLNLRWNDIGDEGAKALAVALAPNAKGVFNTSLNTLHLRENFIGPEGAKALAVALTPNEEGVFNGSLNTLNLEGNEIGPEGAKALAVALTPNEHGVFNGSLNTLDLADNQLCDLNDLGHDTYDASGIKALAKALAFNTSLNTLDVRMNNIIGDAAQQLAVAVLKHPCIKEFNKIRMQDIRDDKVAELDLRGKGIGLPGALVLSKLLVFNGSLSTLDLLRNGIGDEGRAAILALLEQSNSLTSVCGIPPGATKMDLRRGGLGLEDAKLLAGELVFNGSLNTLNLKRNAFGPEGAKALAVALTPNAEGVFNTSLNTLNLSDNQLCGLNDLGHDTYDASGIKALADALAFNTSLNTLILGDNDIGPEGAKALAGALTPNAEGVFNTSLNTLNLARNNIGSEGAKALAVALTPNEVAVFNGSLNTLNLEDNRIGDEGAKALAVALTPNAEGVFNGSLNTLSLHHNDLGDQGEAVVQEAIRKNPNAATFKLHI
ncbi:hypothetical protein CYMTET_9439 [Cymbomonas tetramitiformis]|uniref:Uncharacterized protein n=1 Tax=Cymbomonas tetramitiformis TaxID=36881 RepID=A0AAE0LF06_9CHLO|nr:hypothetical protein CYMTET_9439 [Cymbomonas tetramitiformis]